ncbi:MAG TPA: hypothetical protein VFF53_04275 [Geobacteraceae bacterium]|nr:hypothetical protein [Geobacteraceae bacterium]
MSLILDALRKIEQERKTRRQGNVDLRADVLNYRGSTPPARSRLLPLVVTALVISAASAALLLWRSSSGPRPAAQEIPGSSTLQPAAQPAELQQPPPPALSPQQVAAPPLPVEKAAPATLPATLHRENDTSGDSENLVVSGIAWQEERGLRRAVVNGSLVGEGAEILGARVVEIREARVRFSRGGKSWDIPYAGGSARE